MTNHSLLTYNYAQFQVFSDCYISYMPQNTHLSYRRSLFMQCDVTSCIISISKNVGYLNKEHSYKNLTKELIL